MLSADSLCQMTEIRAMREDELPAVADLLDSLLPEWGGDSAFLEATVLKHPWAESELSSLVAVDDDGVVIGFIGAQARRLRFGERELRGVCCSHLVVAPDRRAGAAGALLLGRLLAGPQDLTWSDTASERVARMWRTFGGQFDHARACDWMLVLRPGGWIWSLVAAAAQRRRIGRDLVPVEAFPIHVVTRRARTKADPDVRGEQASAAQVVAELPPIMGRSRLWVAHDQTHLEHQFALIARRFGELVCRLVRRRDRTIGWYAYVPSRTIASRVLHIAAKEREVEAVLADLLVDAGTRGARVVAGRLEPHLDRPLRSRWPVIGLAREPVFHARDPEIRAAVASSAGLLTQLDSEWFVL